MRTLLLVLILSSTPTFAAPGGIPFDQRQEGIYEVQTTCDPAPNQCNAELMQDLDRVLVVDSHGPTGVWVSFASSQVKYVIDRFMSVEVGPLPDQITGMPKGTLGASRFAYLTMEIDPASGSLNGRLIDNSSTGTYVLTGKPLNRVANLLSASPVSAPPVNAVLGSYKGFLGDLPGSLLVKQLPDGRVIGYFASDEQTLGAPNFSLNFDGGSWDMTNGLLQLSFMDHRLIDEGAMNLILGADSELYGFYIAGWLQHTISFKKV